MTASTYCDLAGGFAHICAARGSKLNFPPDRKRILCSFHCHFGGTWFEMKWKIFAKGEIPSEVALVLHRVSRVPCDALQRVHY